LHYIESLENYSNFKKQNKFDYSNEGLNLLGVIIERVSDLSYEEYLNRYIFDPADMNDTGLSYVESPPNLAKSYILSIEDDAVLLKDNKFYLPKKAYPAGAHYASINDMVKFLKAFEEYKLTSKLMFEEITSLQIIEAKLPNVIYGYGYAFEVIERDSYLSFGHSGGMPGVSTKFEVYPKEDVWIIVLANKDDAGTISTTYIRELLLYN
jgi:CubicO group peptidase (beta-lactamase class C family)